jgi:putative transposase
LSILAYCLMRNHIHLVAVPRGAAYLGEVMQRAHGRYAQYLNARRGRCRHLWQNRFSSCALGPAHLWAAVRYVEMNPVRAGLVPAPRAWKWSSAEAHLSGEDPWRIAEMGFWSEPGRAARWRALLAEQDDGSERQALRRATFSDQPFGDKEFVAAMQAQRESASAGAPPASGIASELAISHAAY